MSQNSSRLELPLIEPSQAQKHVTHNEALQLLDAVVHLSVAAFDTNTPPPLPADGQVFALGVSPSGDWSGEAGNLAIRIASGWIFTSPGEGWRAWSETDAVIKVFAGGAWVNTEQDMDNLDGVGINTTSDSINRLALSSQASLFSHEGAGHQLKINKNATGDTASLLFQTGFTGHAEMGLAGDDAFALKISADGSVWSEAMRADPVAGEVEFSLPITGTAVQQTQSDTTVGRLMRADWGYSPGNAVGLVSESGGLPTGAIVEQGSNANGQYIRWADGTQICVNNAGTLTAASAVICNQTWVFPAVFTSTPDYIDVALSLKSGDWTDTSLRTKVSTTGILGTPTITSANLGWFTSAAAITVTVSNCRFLAIGRWF